MSRYLYMGAETITIDSVHLLIIAELVIVILSIAGIIWSCFTKLSPNKQKYHFIYTLFLIICLFIFEWYLYDVKNDISVRMFMAEYKPLHMLVLYIPFFSYWLTIYIDKKKHH